MSLTILDCSGCGACCLRIRTPPFSEEERPRLPADLLADVVAAEARSEKKLPRDAPCTWFDSETRQCRHYEHRPAVCREFEIGGDFCLWRRRTEGIV